MWQLEYTDKIMTQKEQLLKYFKEIENNITTLECMQKLLILDLQGVIRDLKKEGYNILDFWITKTNMYGERKKFKRYYLIQDKVDYANFSVDRDLIMNDII